MAPMAGRCRYALPTSGSTATGGLEDDQRDARQKSAGVDRRGRRGTAPGNPGQDGEDGAPWCLAGRADGADGADGPPPYIGNGSAVDRETDTEMPARGPAGQDTFPVVYTKRQPLRWPPAA